jgi:hypothetical protein
LQTSSLFFQRIKPNAIVAKDWSKSGFDSFAAPRQGPNHRMTMEGYKVAFLSGFLPFLVDVVSGFKRGNEAQTAQCIAHLLLGAAEIKLNVSIWTRPALIGEGDQSANNTAFLEPGHQRVRPAPRCSAELEEPARSLALGEGLKPTHRSMSTNRLSMKEWPSASIQRSGLGMENERAPVPRDAQLLSRSLSKALGTRLLG